MKYSYIQRQEGVHELDILLDLSCDQHKPLEQKEQLVQPDNYVLQKSSFLTF